MAYMSDINFSGDASGFNNEPHIEIIGGSGFIGARLSRRLAGGKLRKFSIFDKNPSNEFPDLVSIGDVRSVDDLRNGISERSLIVNLAAEHRDDVMPSSLYEDVNVGGARNICTVAREKGVRTIIFTSTVAVYGFAPIGTDEAGKIAPFNDYGRTKYEAEEVFKTWQFEDPFSRTLVIIRPTVVFGEHNRGNVYNLLRLIASGKFVMLGTGENRKSISYVENVAAFIEYSMSFKPGVHIYNFVDKPDFTMNTLVGHVYRILGWSERCGLRLPFALAYFIGKGFDLGASITGRRFAISSIRVKKFCSNSVYSTAIDKTGFVSPVPLEQALEQTVQNEFMERRND
jgi:nucleoside-diphosphate-sugar epimerase